MKERVFQTLMKIHWTEKFDEVLARRLVRLVFGLLYHCPIDDVLRQHKAVNRRPDGLVETAIKNNLTILFLQMVPDVDAARLAAHIDSLLQGFTEASADEISEIRRAAVDVDPVDDKWNFGQTARTIIGVVENFEV